MEHRRYKGFDSGTWLSIMLTYAGDPIEKEGLIARVSERTEILFEKGEEVSGAMIEALLKRARPN